MNPDDEAYYGAAERDRRLDELTRALTALRTSGVRAPVRGDAGTVAVTAFGVVLDVALDEDGSRHLTAAALGEYLVEAIGKAHQAAQRRRDLMLTEGIT